MRSIGIDLEPWVKKGLLQIHASRPTLYGLEQHLVMMHDAVRAFRPSVVVVDPMSNLTLAHDDSEVKPTLMRLIDFLKEQQITTLFTSLNPGGNTTLEAMVKANFAKDLPPIFYRPPRSQHCTTQI